MLKTTSYTIFLFVLFFLGGQAELLSQSTESDENDRRVELGFNATTVLSHFIGNESTVEASDFPVIMRVRTKKVLWRLSLGVNGSSNEFFDNITSSSRTNEFTNYYGKFGFEHEFYKHRKWRGYWGIDFIGLLENDKISSISSFQGTRVVITNTTMGFGAGPILGIKYDITPRLFFSTEASLYGVAKFTELKQEEDGNLISISKTDNYTGALQSPLSLYLNFRL